jgi:ankyrin repeat protein
MDLYNNHHKLLNYVKFDLNYNDFFLRLLCSCKDEKILKHVIDNAVDLECEDGLGRRLIHLICIFSTLEMIKYIIDKGIKLDFNDDFYDKFILENFINKNEKMSYEDKKEMIEYISENKNIKNVMVKKAIKKIEKKIIIN